MIPFVLLLAGIAVLPLIPATAHWWESNLNRFKVAVGAVGCDAGLLRVSSNRRIEGHWPAHHVVAPADGGVQTDFVNTILANAMLQEFVPFIVLLFSLYTISGGIRIAGDLEARPLTNAAFMAVGAVLASFIGTTGAAMLLIRPLLETNRERKHVAHTVVIFIFIVCNCGGCLLPIGDPPLFLGLPGRRAVLVDACASGRNGCSSTACLLVTYLAARRALVLPSRNEARHRPRRSAARIEFASAGWQVNAPLLLGVVLAVALLDPSKPFPGTDWHPWMYLREVVQLCLVGISLVVAATTDSR